MAKRKKKTAKKKATKAVLPNSVDTFTGAEFATLAAEIDDH